MSTALEVVKYAGTFAGITESPPGSNRTQFGRAYGMDGVPWCAMFVWFVLEHFQLRHIKSAYTPTVAQWYADQKRGFTDETKIQVGDLLFFNFPDTLDRIQHIAFATSPFKAGKVETIEGNTSAGPGGSQDNGGGVFRRDRGPAEIVYIGRPFYSQAKPLPRFELPKKRTWLRFGDQGADVKTLERDLNAWMRDLREDRGDIIKFDFGKINADGIFDLATKRALQTFQMQHPRLEPDGIFGRETDRVLEAVRKRQKAA